MNSKGLIRLLKYLSLLLLVIMSTIAIVLNTSFLTPVSNWLAQQMFSPSFYTARVTYEFPLHFQLDEVTWSSSSPSIHKLDIWISPYQHAFDSITLEQVMIDGMEVHEFPEKNVLFPYVHIDQLSGKNIQLTLPNGITFENLKVQMSHPHWTDISQPIPHGQFQLYSDQVIWRGEYAKKVLLTGDYRSNLSEIQALSFEWRDASLSLQAQEKEQRWTISNLTIEKLSLSLPQVEQIEHKLHDTLFQYIHQIDRIDVLSSYFSSADLSLNNFDLSATNIDMQSGLSRFFWQQKDATLSLNAESVDWAKTQWVEPNINLNMSPNRIHISDLNSFFNAGEIHSSVTITPDSAVVHDLSLQNIKLILEPEHPFPVAQSWQWLQSLEQLTIEQLTMNNGQIIQLQHQPYWQMSGLQLNLDGVQLKQKGAWGFDQGKLRASAGSVSYGDVVGEQALVEMHHQHQTLYLDQFIVPLKAGYVKAVGQWAHGKRGSPWSLQVEGDSLPLKLLSALPFQMTGLTDFSLSAHGLSGDTAIMAQTLTGQLNVSIRQGEMHLPNGEHATLKFELPQTTVNSDRGQIHIPLIQLETASKNMNAAIQGEWYFSRLPEGGNITLSIGQGSQVQHYDLLDPSLVTP